MNNREILIQKSLALFAKRGYEAVGVQEICESSGVTKPTLYHYFGSKRGLLDAIIENYGKILIEYIKNAAVYSGDLPYSIEKSAGAFFQFARENQDFYRMKLSLYFAPMESEPNQAVRVLDERVFNLLVEMVHSAIDRYGNIRGREKITVSLIIGGINTCIGLWLNGLMELSENNIRQNLRLMQYGIYT
jgi:TetR/AcrR family transcriptional regulator